MTYTPPLNGGRINVTVGGNSTSAGAGYALASTGTVTLAGGNNITLSQNGNAVTISGAAGGAGGVAVANSQTTYSSGTVNMLEGGGAITIASGAGQSMNFSVPQTSSLSATGAVSISTNASTISIGAPTQTVQPGIASIQASNTTYTSGNVIFSNANGMSFGSSAGSAITASYTVPTQTVQPGIASIQASNTTYTSGKVIFSNANGMSFGSSAGSAITGSYTVPTQTNQSVGLYAVSNTTVNTSGTADARSVSFAGAGGVSVQATNGSVLISGGAAGGLNAGMSTGGNTAGTTGTVSNQLIFAGGNNVTLSQATGAGGNTLTISAPNFATATAPFAEAFGGNTSGGANSTVSSGSLNWYGGNNITLNQSQQSVTISGGNGFTYSYFNPQDAYLQVAGQIGQKTLMMQPMQAPNVQFDRIMLPINYSNASNSSNSFTVTASVGVYTRNASTLSLLFSASASYNITNSGTAGSYNNYGGMRLMSVGAGANSTLAEGQYWVGMVSSTATGGGAGMSMSNMMASQINSSFSGIFGVVSNASAQYTRGLGWLSVTTGAIPNSVAFSDLVGNSSAALRQPLYYLVSGTI